MSDFKLTKESFKGFFDGWEYTLGYTALAVLGMAAFVGLLYIIF